MAGRKPNRYSSEHGQDVWRQLERITDQGFSYATVFADWLDLILNSLLSLSANFRKPNFMTLLQQNAFDDVYNERYLQVLRRYRTSRKHRERPADYFAYAWGLVQKETHEKQQDVLGEIFIDRISYGEGGQCFTPASVADLMGKILGDEAPEIVFDPYCGSGRLLLSAAKEHPNTWLYGNDLDVRCAKMTTINMWLFDLESRITCGNALTNEWNIGWISRKGGYLYEINPQATQSARAEGVSISVEQPLPRTEAGGQVGPPFDGHLVSRGQKDPARGG